MSREQVQLETAIEALEAQRATHMADIVRQDLMRGAIAPGGRSGPGRGPARGGNPVTLAAICFEDGA